MSASSDALTARLASVTVSPACARFLPILFREEGGVSNDVVNDPNGGYTKYGFSSIQNPDIDVPNLTLENAGKLAYQRYWLVNNLDLVPEPVAWAIMDCDFNEGVKVGAKTLQQALGVTQDGVIGEVTESASHKQDPIVLAARVIALRAMEYAAMALFKNDGEGWMYRLATLSLAIGMGPGATGEHPIATPKESVAAPEPALPAPEPATIANHGTVLAEGNTVSNIGSIAPEGATIGNEGTIGSEGTTHTGSTFTQENVGG